MLEAIQNLFENVTAMCHHVINTLPGHVFSSKIINITDRGQDLFTSLL